MEKPRATPCMGVVLIALMEGCGSSASAPTPPQTAPTEPTNLTEAVESRTLPTEALESEPEPPPSPLLVGERPTVWVSGPWGETGYSLHFRRAGEIQTDLCEGGQREMCLGSGGPSVVAVDGASVRFTVLDDDGQTPLPVELTLSDDGATLTVVQFLPLDHSPVSFRRQDQVELALGLQLRDMAHDDRGQAHDPDDFVYFIALYEIIRDGLLEAGSDLHSLDIDQVFELEGLAADAAGGTTPPRGCRPNRPRSCGSAYARAREAVQAALPAP